MIIVVNRNNYNKKAGDIAIDIMQSNGSALGNRYYRNAKMSRDEKISAFRKRLWKEMQTLDSKVLKKLRSIQKLSKNHTVYLVCCCKPKNCHGDVIVTAIDWLNKQ